MRVNIPFYGRNDMIVVI